MMKSFFKKLAFVMALAMVVTTAAPAALSAYAATEFTYAYQNAGAVDTLYMKAGDEVDLCFKGVKDYANYDLQWKSANPLVATVDTKGVVKAVENGTTTVELVVGDGSVYTSTPVKVVVGEEVKVALGTSKDDTFTAKTLEVGTSVDLGFYGVPNYSAANYSHTWISNAPEVAKVDQKGNVVAVASGSATVTVALVNNVTGETLTVAPVVFTVPTPVVEVSYEVKQVSDTQAKLVFNQDVNFNKSDVTLEIVYDGGYPSNWPIKDFECKGNVITFAPYVPFQDGDQYQIKVGDGEFTPFTTKIQFPNRIEVTYSTPDMGDMGNGMAYTNGEEGVELTVKLSSKLFYNDIDVSSIYSASDIVYSLTTENENVMIDEYEGTLTFSKANVPVEVIATYTNYDGEEEKNAYGVVEMKSTQTPAYTVTGVKAWTVVTSGTEIDWSKQNHTLPAYDEGQIVALITDNYGNLTATVDGYTHKNAGATVKNPVEGTRFYDEGYSVTYTSANNEKLLVGTDGSVTTYVEVKDGVPAIFKLCNESEDIADKNIYAGAIVVTEARRFDKLELDKTSLALTTDGRFTTDKVTLKAKDQYGNAWTESVTVTVTNSVENTLNAPEGDYTFTDKQDFNLDGDAVYCTKNAFTLTFKSGNKTASLKVSLKDPKYYDHDDDKETDDIIKITSYKIEAKDANQTIAKLSDNKTATVNATISYYELSNGLKIDTVATVINAEKVETAVTLVTKAEELVKTTAEVTKGDQFVVVYYPDGSIVSGVTDGDFPGEYNVTVASPNADGQMQYDKTGTYTVKVLQVSSFNKEEKAVFSTKYSTTFKVENKNPEVAVLDQADIDVTDNDIDQTDLSEIIAAAIKFKRGGSEWKDFKADMIDIKATLENEKNVIENKMSGYIVVTNVVINVPLNGKDDAVYYTVTVPVNKAIKVDESYFAQ